MTFSIPTIVKYVIEKLNNNGFLAYLVGGSVRDAIMGYDITDYDITTNASLDEIKLVFSLDKVKLYSNKMTLCIIKDNQYVEVTPFKGRTIEEDLANRDFTINAIAYDLKNIIDPYNGRKDLINKIIRTPIDSNITINKDPIRILRAIRFSSKFSFEINSDLINTINNSCDLLLQINKDRIRLELDKILTMDNPSFYIKKYKNVFFKVIPELEQCDGFDQQTKYHNLDVLSHILKVVDNVDNNIILRLAALFHDIKKPNCFSIDEKGGHFYDHWNKSKDFAKVWLKEYNYSNDIINRVCNLIEYHDYRIENNTSSILMFIYKYKRNDIDLLFNLKYADIMAQHPNYNYQIKELEDVYYLVKDIINTKNYIDIDTINITNEELIKLGYNPLSIKYIMDKVCLGIIKEKVDNDKSSIIKYIKCLYLEN